MMPLHEILAIILKKLLYSTMKAVQKITLSKHTCHCNVVKLPLLLYLFLLLTLAAKFTKAHLFTYKLIADLF